MIGYDDDQLGPLEEVEEGEGGDHGVGGDETKGVQETILNSAVNEFIQKYENTTTRYCTYRQLLQRVSSCYSKPLNCSPLNELHTVHVLLTATSLFQPLFL